MTTQPITSKISGKPLTGGKVKRFGNNGIAFSGGGSGQSRNMMNSL